MALPLIQNVAGSVVVYLEDTGGSPEEDLTASDINVSLKKSGAAFFSPKAVTTDVDATATIGSGANGTVTVSVPGTAGNTYTVEVVVPGGTTSLSASLVGTALTVSLATSSGSPVAASNTATLVAGAIEALGTEVGAVASGTGVDPLTSAEGPTSLTGGGDGTFTELGGGFYEIDLSASDTDTLGTLYVRVQGGTIRSQIEAAFVYEDSAAASSTALSVSTSTLFGYLTGADGSPISGAKVSAKVSTLPTVVHPGAEGYAVTDDLVTTSTDSNGYFVLTLAAGLTVEVFIPSVSYRRVLTVPATSRNLFDIA